ncbi:MAG: cyclodeaminase/cyclohydrolase family protein [Candidatus Azotimanducaceae bacterium]|uniref:Cyclodeaminase/cyclohydrolase domain-containing protein n=1 Tax=OM182 bacterium TaxID=2510334 RepID=A0A520S3Q7_9GAMM|nr:MAG: hypothetical protein EVA68_02445 [OM182 bacterium]
MSNPLCNLTIKDYLAALASKSATPGGGSAAALTAAQGASLLSMVCQFTQSSDKSIIERGEACLSTYTKLLLLAQEDVDAFNNVIKWYSNIESDDYRNAVRQAIVVSLSIMREASELVDAAKYLSEAGNKNLITDVAIGANLLSSAIESASVNVLINCKSIPNEELCKKSKQASIRYLESSNQLQQVYLLIKQRI